MDKVFVRLLKLMSNSLRFKIWQRVGLGSTVLLVSSVSFVAIASTQNLKQKISQAELAKMVCSHQPAIARMESGQISEVSLDFLCKVALALSVSVTIRAPAA